MRLRLRRRQALSGAGFIEFDHVEPFAKRGSADRKTFACCAGRTICSARADVLVPCTSAPKLPTEGAPSRRLEREDDQEQRHRRVDERFSARGRFAVSRLRALLVPIRS